MNLVLPETLSFPTAAEAPAGWDLEALRQERDAARIEPGYRLHLPSGPAPYVFHATCNVDTPQLWLVFERLVEILPEPVGLLFGVKDRELEKLPYAPKDQILPTLRLFRRELTTDGLLQLGLIHQTEDRSEEVFIAPAKYLRVWGTDLGRFRATMHGLGLEEKADLRFVDEFPLVFRTLSALDPTALSCGETLERVLQRLAE